jgi:ubiquinone/menaquinone biosynthesis C-methylase UbiE
MFEQVAQSPSQEMKVGGVDGIENTKSNDTDNSSQATESSGSKETMATLIKRFKEFIDRQNLVVGIDQSALQVASKYQQDNNMSGMIEYLNRLDIMYTQYATNIQFNGGAWELVDQLPSEYLDEWRNLSAPDQDKALRDMLLCLETSICGLNPELVGSFLERLLDDSKDSNRTLRFLLQHITLRKRGLVFNHLDPDGVCPAGNMNYLLANEITRIDDYLYQALNLLTTEIDIEAQRQMLGTLVQSHSLPKVLSAMRKGVTSGRISGQGIDKCGRLLLGIDPEDTTKPFAKSVKEFYDNFCKDVDFSHYKPNHDQQKYDDMIIDELYTNVKDKVVLDTSAGTGRIIRKFAQKGASAYGFDIDPKMVQVARNTEQVTGEVVKYAVGDWSHIALPSNSVDILVCLGRSLLHVENWDGLLFMMKEAIRVLKPGGKIILDIPNPYKGKYLANHIAVYDVYKSLGTELQSREVFINELKAGSQPFDFIVGSPDGVNFINRFSPSPVSFETVIQKWFPCKARVVGNCPIFANTDDENIYIEVEKLSEKLDSVDEAEKRLASLINGEYNNKPVTIY